MDRLFTFTLAIAVCLGTTAFLRGNRSAIHEVADNSQLAGDGAFRDGLYLGRLTAQQGRPARPPIGRWSNTSDRTSFLAGYRRGYDAAVSGVQTTNQTRAEYIRKFGI